MASVGFAPSAQAQTTSSQTASREFGLWTIAFRTSLDALIDIVQSGVELDQTLTSREQGAVTAASANTTIDAWLQRSQLAVQQERHAIQAQPPPPALDAATEFGVRARPVAANAASEADASAQRIMRMIVNLALIAHDGVNGGRVMADAHREIRVTIAREILALQNDWYRLSAPLVPPQAVFGPVFEIRWACSDAVVVVLDVGKRAPDQGFAFTPDQITALRNDAATIRRNIPVARARIAANPPQTGSSAANFPRILDLAASGADQIDAVLAAPVASNVQEFMEQTRALGALNDQIDQLLPHR